MPLSEETKLRRARAACEAKIREIDAKLADLPVEETKTPADRSAYFSEYLKKRYEEDPEFKEKRKAKSLSRYESMTEEQKKARLARQRELYALRKQEALQTLVAGGTMIGAANAGAGVEIKPPVKRRPRKELTEEEKAAKEEKKKEARRKHAAKKKADAENK